MLQTIFFNLLWTLGVVIVGALIIIIVKATLDEVFKNNKNK